MSKLRKNNITMLLQPTEALAISSAPTSKRCNCIQRKLCPKHINDNLPTEVNVINNLIICRFTYADEAHGPHQEATVHHTEKR